MNEPEVLAGQRLGEAQRIALAYAQKSARSRWAGMFLLDAQLLQIALHAREPMLAQLKLAWWRDACADISATHSHPVLCVLADAWGAGSAQLAGLIDAWEELATDSSNFPLGVGRVAEARASACAAAGGTLVNGATHAAASRWSLVSLARHAPSSDQRESMIAAARSIGRVSLPRALRPLTVLDGLAGRALRRGSEDMLGDRLSPLAAIRLGIFGR